VRVSRAHSKTEAKRLAADLERQQERQRLRLEPLPPPDGGGTLREILRWWLDTYSRKSPAHARNTYSINKHFFTHPIADLNLVDVTPGVIERFLQEKAPTHAPQTLNHLRRHIMSAFSRARKTERYVGPNPAEHVERAAGSQAPPRLPARRGSGPHPGRLVRSLALAVRDRDLHRHAQRGVARPQEDHLLPEYLRAEIDRLSFGLKPEQNGSPRHPLAPGEPELLTASLQGVPKAGLAPSAPSENPNGLAPFDGWARRDSNPLPPASEAGTLSR
jgi:hypothetical protein